jgi:hypothetical protein
LIEEIHGDRNQKQKKVPPSRRSIQKSHDGMLGIFKAVNLDQLLQPHCVKEFRNHIIFVYTAIPRPSHSSAKHRDAPACHNVVQVVQSSVEEKPSG